MSPRTAAVQVKEVAPVVTALVVAGEFHLEALDNGERRQIEVLTAQLHEAKKAFTDATLKVGEVLSGIHAILEPRGAFTAYLKTMGGMSKATGYRFLLAYQNLKEKYPELILVRIIAAGIPMYGASKKEPFGSYTKAVNKTPLPKGILTEERADEYVEALQEKHRTLQAANRKKGQTPEALQDRFVSTALKMYNKIGESDRLVWLREGLERVAKNIGLSISLAISPGMTAEQILLAAHPGAKVVETAKRSPQSAAVTH